MVERLESLSNQLADAVAAAAPSVVQVLGARRPASGVVHADGVVVTTGHLSGPAYGADRQSTAVLSERDGRLQISGEGRSDRGPFSYVIQKTN